MAEFQMIGGEVTNLRFTIDTHAPTISYGAPPVRQLAHCTIEGHTIAYSDTQPMFVREGDAVWVAGERDERGVFRAVAYRNLTSGVEGCRDARARYAAAAQLLALALFFAIVGAAAVAMEGIGVVEALGGVTARPMVLLAVVAGVIGWMSLLGAGLTCVRRAKEPRRALRAVREATPDGACMDHQPHREAERRPV